MLAIMTLPASRTQATMTRSEREALLNALLLGEPELGFTPRGNPDPRLVGLVRLLARAAARDFVEAEERENGRHHRD